ncbi:hypothetical protein RRSWK_01467 [Rhodopirellula sp. SWK7]|nr:hypothetical protein RRSWK_01467 [Rhodopirellula sp. SWK7]
MALRKGGFSLFSRVVSANIQSIRFFARSIDAKSLLLLFCLVYQTGPAFC